eukprot:s1156_g14.t1
MKSQAAGRDGPNGCKLQAMSIMFSDGLPNSILGRLVGLADSKDANNFALAGECYANALSCYANDPRYFTVLSLRQLDCPGAGHNTIMSSSSPIGCAAWFCGILKDPVGQLLGFSPIGYLHALICDTSPITSRPLTQQKTSDTWIDMDQHGSTI